MSDRTDIKIFIASSGELNEERNQSIIVLADLNKRYPHLHLEPMLFEIDTPSGNFPWKQRVQDGINPKLNESHIVVVLFYSKVGAFTKEEFELALSQQKKVYLFLKEGFSPNNTGEAEKCLQVQKLKEKVEKESAIRYQPYKTLNDYYNLLYRDLERYIDATYPAPASAPSATISTSQQHIPRAPRPYLAHPYSIVKNFTGRREEMTRLTEWLKYDKEPMCVVDAIGGMGKSTLCWKWLKDEIIETNTDREGIVWWSFYDQGFEDFIHHMYEYCIPEEVRRQHQRIDKTTEVINALTNHKFLLVLDGFERILRGYAEMMAMYIQETGISRYQPDEMKGAFDVYQRTPITPKAEKLLRALCSGSSKTLMTTRLFPSTIEDLDGVKHIPLTGLSKTDTISFFEIEGITGTDEDIIRAGNAYWFHPLMLKLLSTAIKRSFTPNINKALKKGLIDEKEPQKILTTTYQLLNQNEKNVASAISVFRTAFTFDAAKELFPDAREEALEEIMIELRNMGFLLHNEEQHIFDFHPIMRSYLYNRIPEKGTVHQLALNYFSSLPVKEKIKTFADLEPLVEQFHHLTRAGKHAQAYELYTGKLAKQLFHQLAQYTMCKDICQQLLSTPTDQLIALDNGRAHGYIHNQLGLCYSAIGQLKEATENHFKSLLNHYKTPLNEGNMGVGLLNIADSSNTYSGKLSAAVIHLTKGAAIGKIKDPFYETSSFDALITIHTYQAYHTDPEKASVVEDYLVRSMRYCKMEQHTGLASRISFGYTKWTLSFIKNVRPDHVKLKDALNSSLQAMYSVNAHRTSSSPDMFYILYTYEAISVALLMVIPVKGFSFDNYGKVYFYDESFHKIIDTITPTPKNYLSLAERCIHEGLTLSRKTNRAFEECTFSLLLARIEWLKVKKEKNVITPLKEVEKVIIETHSQAKGIGYRIILTDLHLFCTEVLFELNRLVPGHKEKLLGLSAKEHIKKVREYAIDTSTLEDIFLPPNTDTFYAGIPEYEMLKRGLTDEERIQHGYYAAWLRADQLEERLITSQK